MLGTVKLDLSVCLSALLQVANIVGRTELLSGMFFLLSLLSYQCCLNHKHRKETNKHPHQEPLDLEQLQHSAPTRFSWLWLACSILLAMMSMLCKEQGITVLGVCLAYDLFVACGKDLWGFLLVLKQTVGGVWSREDASRKRLGCNIELLSKRRSCDSLSLSLSFFTHLHKHTGNLHGKKHFYCELSLWW